MNRPSAKIIETIKSKFSSPDEFVTQYNAYLMSRLKDQELDSWFNSIPEEELDTANEYYLTNTKIKKFNHDLQSIKRKCRTKAQREAFNNLIEAFRRKIKSK